MFIHVCGLLVLCSLLCRLLTGDDAFLVQCEPETLYMRVVVPLLRPDAAMKARLGSREDALCSKLMGCAGRQSVPTSFACYFQGCFALAAVPGTMAVGRNSLPGLPAPDTAFTRICPRSAAYRKHQPAPRCGGGHVTFFRPRFAGTSFPVSHRHQSAALASRTPGSAEQSHARAWVADAHSWPQLERGFNPTPDGSFQRGRRRHLLDGAPLDKRNRMGRGVSH